MFKPAAQNQMPPRMILDSRAAILALSPVLESFAERCGQFGAMHWLPYFLDEAVTGRRLPRLVLLLKPEESSRPFSADDLLGAVLFFEYQACGMRTGVVATADAVGFNSVIAPAACRAEIAAAATQALLQEGATTVLATFAGNADLDVRTVSLQADASWATRQRVVPRMLRLRPTLDQTLAQMGKATRANMRRYRRRLEVQVGCEFIPDAAPLLQGADLAAINARSLNPVADQEFARRVACASNLRGSFLSGLRDSNGNWLSLMGGWRQGTTTVLHWQMNAAGLEKFSVGTVMRSYFLEGEIARGTREVLLFGGTSHGMRSAFQQESVADLVMERPGVRALAVRAVAKLLFSGGLALYPNFLAETLASAALVWSRSRAYRPEQDPVLWQPVRSQRAA
jgi:hypothetical protein